MIVAGFAAKTREKIVTPPAHPRTGIPRSGHDAPGDGANAIAEAVHQHAGCTVFRAQVNDIDTACQGAGTAPEEAPCYVVQHEVDAAVVIGGDEQYRTRTVGE